MAAGGCGTDPPVCTAESVALTVVVVNGTGQDFPAMRVEDTVLRTGNVLDISASHPPASLAAGGSSTVVVFSDLFRDVIPASGEAVAVAVIAPGYSASGRYEFGTDGCHVRKLTGPDTLEFTEPPPSERVAEPHARHRAERAHRALERTPRSAFPSSVYAVGSISRNGIAR